MPEQDGFLGKALKRASGFIRKINFVAAGYRKAKIWNEQKKGEQGILPSTLRGIGNTIRAGIFSGKAIGLYLWPFAARWKNPFSWLGFKKKFARVTRATGVFAGLLLLHQVLQSSTALLFPTAEEFLEKEGLDPAIAQQLSDKKIHVRSQNFWGKLHSINELPTIFGAAFMGGIIELMPGQSYTVREPLIILNRFGSFDKLNRCRMTLQDEEKTTTKNWISFVTDIPEKDIRTIPVTDKESFLAVTFHEFAHCHRKNGQAGKMSEINADARGAWKAAEALDNPEIIKLFLYARAMKTNKFVRTGRIEIEFPGHNAALYLDAKLRGTPLPKASELSKLNDNVFDLSRIFAEKNKDTIKGPDYRRTALALQGVLDHHGDLLSKLEKRRAELYIEAVEYFVPKATIKLTKQPSP